VCQRISKPMRLPSAVAIVKIAIPVIGRSRIDEAPRTLRRNEPRVEVGYCVRFHATNIRNSLALHKAGRSAQVLLPQNVAPPTLFVPLLACTGEHRQTPSERRRGRTLPRPSPLLSDQLVSGCRLRLSGSGSYPSVQIYEAPRTQQPPTLGRGLR
jgi:hypothetical protein